MTLISCSITEDLCLPSPLESYGPSLAPFGELVSEIVCIINTTGKEDTICTSMAAMFASTKHEENSLYPKKVLNAPLSTQGIRHDQVKTWSPVQSGSLFEKQRDHSFELDNDSEVDSLTPPPPADLEALRETWEKVKLYNIEISKVYPQKKTIIIVITNKHP